MLNKMALNAKRGGMSIDPKDFWEKKILAWEVGRYSKPKEQVGIIEWIANRSSMSLRFRVRIAPELLQPFLQDKRVIEVGCGSGLIARTLIDFGAANYLGIDIAQAAITRAQERSENQHQRIKFLQGGVNEVAAKKGDVVISLGLLDWLTDREIMKLFENSDGADFLHAIAERRSGVQQWLHRSYVHLAYGHKTQAYRPRYFTPQHIEALAGQVASRPLHIYRDRRLSFGALISSLPIGQPI
jgi:SAM-dependent methyltransferase